MNLLPNNRLLLLLAALTAVYGIMGIATFFTEWSVSSLLWIIATGAFALVAFDALQVWKHHRQTQWAAEREMPHHFIVGEPSKVTLHLSRADAATVPLTLRIFDHLPPTFELLQKTLPTVLTLLPGENAEIPYQVKPLQRGAASFSGVQLRLQSPWGLWQMNRFLTVEDAVKTYPDFRRLDDNDLLSDDAQSHGTLPHHRKRGSGTDFAELREYRVGDALNHIDHKASARMNKLITKSFQIERDQQVMILLDCSRRLRVFQSTLSHFDYALNTSIYLARTILNQGDAVGLMNFGSHEMRYSPAKKGRNSVNRLLNQVYDLTPSRQAPDYIRAAEQFMVRQKRRSLVIVITSLQEEDTESVKTMLRILQKRHLVLIANLKEELLGETLDVSDLDSAVYYAARETYHRYRNQMLHQISNKQLILLDTYPTSLTAKLLNLYLNIKQSGRF